MSATFFKVLAWPDTNRESVQRAKSARFYHTASGTTGGCEPLDRNPRLSSGWSPRTLASFETQPHAPPELHWLDQIENC